MIVHTLRRRSKKAFTFQAEKSPCSLTSTSYLIYLSVGSLYIVFTFIWIITVDRPRKHHALLDRSSWRVPPPPTSNPYPKPSRDRAHLLIPNLLTAPVILQSLFSTKKSPSPLWNALVPHHHLEAHPKMVNQAENVKRLARHQVNPCLLVVSFSLSVLF